MTNQPTCIPYPDTFNDDNEIFDFWNQRTEDLQMFFAAIHQQYTFEVDLAKNAIHWVSNAGEILVKANCKVILSYSHSNHSAKPAWHMPYPDNVAVAPVDDMPELIDDADINDAWFTAMFIATHANADFIFRVDDPQNDIFLALYDVQSTEPLGEEKIEGQAYPEDRMIEMVNLLEEFEHRSPSEMTTLLRNYSATYLLKSKRLLDNASEEYLTYTDMLAACAAALNQSADLIEKQNNVDGAIEVIRNVLDDLLEETDSKS